MEPGAEKYPVKALVALSLAFFAHCYALSSLFPYVGFMMEEIGVVSNTDNAGKYAGYVSASFMVGRFLSSYYWGHFADVYGRLPVVYITLIAISIFSITFGLATNFWVAVTSRFLIGFFDGVVITGRAQISELTTTKEMETTAMGLLTGMWSLGFIMGPAMGGFLAMPTDQYSFLRSVPLFDHYPFLLPNILGSFFAIIAFPMVYWWLPETRVGRKELPGIFRILQSSDLDIYVPHKDDVKDLTHEDLLEYEEDLDEQEAPYDEQVFLRGRASSVESLEDVQVNAVEMGSMHRPLLKDHPNSEGFNSDAIELGDVVDDSDSDDDIEEQKQKENDKQPENEAAHDPMLKLKTLLGNKLAMTTIFFQAFHSLMSIMIDEVFPLWAITSGSKGGLNLKPNHVGQLLSGIGIFLVLFQVTLYPKVSNYLGPVWAFRVATFVAAPTYLLLPLANNLMPSSVRNNPDAPSKEPPLRVIFMVIGLVSVMKIAGNLCSASVSLLMNNVVEGDLRGTLNGLGMTTNSIAKAVGPAIGAVLYAWSLRGGASFPFDFHFVFMLLGIYALLFLCSLAFLLLPGDFKLLKDKEHPANRDSDTKPLIEKKDSER